MAKTYIDNKAGKKKSAKKAGWVLVLLALIFIFVLVKFARNAGIGFAVSGLPSDEDAYEVAKDFVKSTVRSNSIEFPSTKFGIAKKSDSVYVVRSVVRLSSGGGEKRMTNFKVLMEYKGGKHDELKNWNLLNISEEQ